MEQSETVQSETSQYKVVIETEGKLQVFRITAEHRTVVTHARWNSRCSVKDMHRKKWLGKWHSNTLFVIAGNCDEAQELLRKELNETKKSWSKRRSLEIKIQNIEVMDQCPTQLINLRLKNTKSTD